MSNREPLAMRAAVVTFLQLLLIAVGLQGLLNLSAEQTAAWSAVISAGGTGVVVLWTRGKVTPVDDPRTADGISLVPVTQKFGETS